MRESWTSSAGEDACFVTYLTLRPPLHRFHGLVTQMAPQSNFNQSCSNYQFLLKSGEVDALRSGKQSMITYRVETVLEPLWPIGSVIIQDDLCMVYAIMLCTELNTIFHLFDCNACGGTYCDADKMAGKKGHCGVLISVDSTESSGSVFGWTLGPVSPVTHFASNLHTTDGCH